MRAGERSGWYMPALIVGMAVATFLLGLATAMWLPTASLPVVVPGIASIQGRVGMIDENRTSGSAGSPEGPAQATAATVSAPGSAHPAVSPAPLSPAAVASPVPPAAVPASAPGQASPAAPKGADFSLQLGAFLDMTKAKSAADQLAARGYSPASTEAADGYGRTWHYVRLGAFNDERAAALAASDLFERAGIGAAVVRLSAANAGR
jgi:cell division septation protein DedD